MGGVQVSPEHIPWLVAGFVFTGLLLLGTIVIVSHTLSR